MRAVAVGCSGVRGFVQAMLSLCVCVCVCLCVCVSDRVRMAVKVATSPRDGSFFNRCDN